MQKSIIIYARYSSDNQRAESITAQLRACKDYAKKKGYSIIGIYTDESKTGTNDNRSGFQEIMTFIENNPSSVQIVLVHKLDRFARNRYDSAIYRKKLEKAGVRLESVLENFDDSPESVLLESVIEGYNEYYSKNLARETMKGMKETALQAKHTGGHPPLGYDVSDNKTYIINPIHSEAIRIIFERFSQGYSYKAIIEELALKGLKTRNRKPFGQNSLYDILRNKKYTGCYIFNLKTGKDSSGKRNNHSLKELDEIVIIPNAFPEIISDELYNSVQKRLDDRRKDHSQGSQKAKVVYLLSGRVWCGLCGNKMTGTSSSYKTRVSGDLRRRHQYECNFAKRTHNCDMKKIAKEKIESMVLKELMENIFSETHVDRLVKEIFNFQDQQLDKIEPDIKQFDKEIKKLDTSIDNIVTAISMGGKELMPLIERLKVLEEERETIKHKKIKLSAPSPKVSVEKIEAYLKEHKEKVLEQDPMLKKQVVELFVEHVRLNQNTVNIAFTVPVVTDGGGGGSRTPVRKQDQKSFSERSP